MAKSAVYSGRGQSGDVSFNMTPMIDCVFQLIIFFILAGQVASQSLARVDLYKPWKSQAQKWNEKDPNRVIVNIPSKAGPEEKVSSPIPPFPARTPGTHAEHAATMATALWACEIRAPAARASHRLRGLTGRSAENRRGRRTQPTQHAW